MFIGPVLMHQRKDWKTYSRFANSLITECPALQGIIACGTDGEAALINGLKRNLLFSQFLRCFIHFKAVQERGLSPATKNLFLEEIFGKQVEDTKYTGLVDSSSLEEFDSNLTFKNWRTSGTSAKRQRIIYPKNHLRSMNGS